MLQLDWSRSVVVLGYLNCSTILVRTLWIREDPCVLDSCVGSPAVCRELRETELRVLVCVAQTKTVTGSNSDRLILCGSI